MRSRNARSGARTRHAMDRRTFLRSSSLAALGVGAAALIGCSQDDTPTTTSTATATATAAASSTGAATATAAGDGVTRGGTYRTRITGDPPTLNPYGSASFQTKLFAAYAYGRLFRIDAQPETNPYNQGVIPDIADSVETSDGQHWVVKLKPDVKFQDITPVSGRNVTADDVIYSWDLLTAEDSVNAVNVEDIVSATAVDDTTVEFVTANPSAIFLEKLADANNLWVLPTEADGGFDVNQTAIGSGPWIVDNYAVSSRLEYSRNPNYWDSDRPYLDKVEESIIPEYANAKAQFQAGNLDLLGVAADDVLELYGGGNDLQWVGQVLGGVQYIFFSPEDKDPDAPWRDPRYRIAISMALKRDEQMELAYNINALKEAGLDPSESWNNIVAVSLGRWWLDPTSAEQGDSAANFAYNPEEAKKLISAVGGDDVKVKWQYAGQRYGTAFDRVAELTGGQLAALGVPVETEIQDYSATYFPQTRAGNFNGLAMGITPGYPEVSGFVDRYFSSGSSNASKIDDPEINALRAKQVQELDEDARLEQIKQIQIINAENMYYLPLATGAGTTFTAYQPEVRGIRSTRGYGAPTDELIYYWLDV